MISTLKVKTCENQNVTTNVNLTFQTVRLFGRGDFVLYKNTERNFEVRKLPSFI